MLRASIEDTVQGLRALSGEDVRQLSAVHYLGRCAGCGGDIKLASRPRRLFYALAALLEELQP